jgi:hypothetical protein
MGKSGRGRRGRIRRGREVEV